MIRGRWPHRFSTACDFDDDAFPSTRVLDWSRCMRAFALLLLASGCGLISSEDASYDLDLPDKTFSVDTAKWMVDEDHAHALLQTSCASAPSVCSSAATQACGAACTGACSSTTHTCELSLAVSLYQTIDLVKDAPALQQVDASSHALLSVTVDDVTYAMSANTLDIATPPLTIYVAPSSVVDPSDPQARAVGTIAAIPAMDRASGSLQFVDGGKDALTEAMSSFKSPFNILVGATLMITASDPLPTGKLDAIVHVRAHAGL